MLQHPVVHEGLAKYLPLNHTLYPVMKTHLLKIATACVYGLAASPHEGSAPATPGILVQVAEAMKHGIEMLAALVRNLNASQADIGSTFQSPEPFLSMNLVLWAVGTGLLVVAATWLGRSNLAPLR